MHGRWSRRRTHARAQARTALRVALAASLAFAWVPAWHAAFGSATAKAKPVVSPFISLGAVDGRQLVLDVRNGRRLVVPATVPVLGRLPITPEARAELAGKLPNPVAHLKVPAGAHVRNPSLPRSVAPAAAGTPTAVRTTSAAGDPWDPKVAGTRQSVFYPPVSVTHGPGTVSTVLGGRCDGLPGLEASVSPGNVAVDHAGRVFWVDIGSDLHAQPSAYIRTLDRDGRVRTLGNLNGPLEGRFGRGWGGIESNDIRIVPDQKGGVFYTLNRWVDDGYPGGPDWQARDVPAGGPMIGRLRADGSDQFVAGSLLFPADGNDGRDVSTASFSNIAAMAADDEGNLYVADSSPSYFADASITGFPTGPADAPSSNRFGTDQPGYTARTKIRFLNFSSQPKTFYAGTGYDVTIAPHTVGTIAGDTTSPPFTDTTFGTTPSPAPGDAPVPAPSAHIPFIAGMVVGPHGLTMLASSETYRGVGTPDGPLTWVVQGSSVYLLGLNTGGSSARMSGTPVDPATVASLGGGTPGYAGDGGPVSHAQFDVRDHDGWFYGDLVADGRGGLLVADTYNNAIRDIAPSGTIRTVAGGATKNPFDRLDYPMGVAVTPHGLVVSDWGSSRVLAAGPTGHLTMLAGNGQAGFCGVGTAAAGDVAHPADLTGGPLARNRAFLTGADLGDAVDAVTDSHGVTYAAIPNYGVVVRVGTDGTVSIAAGTLRSCAAAPPIYYGLTLNCQPPTIGSGDGGRPQDAVLEDPESLLLDQYDNLYISDGEAVRYVNFGTRTLRPQGVAVRPGTIGTVYRHPGLRLHLPLFPTIGRCEDFCNTYLDVVIGLGSMTLDPRRGTLFVTDLLHGQVLAVNYCGKDYLVAGRASTLVTQVAALLGLPPPTAAPLADGKPAYNVTISPAALAYDSRRDLLLMTDMFTTTGAGTSAGRVLAVNVGAQPVDLWGYSLEPRTIATYAGGSGCASDAFCSYGDGSHARQVAFLSPFGLDVGSDGSVYVAEYNNRVRRIAPDGLVGTVAGNTRDTYDPYAIGSAAPSWWYFGGECADGGAASTACFAGLHSLHIDAAGDAVVTDETSGRIRRITQIVKAPLRPDAQPVRGAGWGFTPAVRLPDLGQQATDASLAVDGQGNVYAMAPTTTSAAASAPVDSVFAGFGMRKMPCAVWSYAIDADGHGHDAPTYLGQPDAASSSATSTRTCSLAASPSGSTPLTPPTGTGDRLVFSSGPEREFFTDSTLTAGASRDGAHTFLTSPNAAVTTTATADLDNPSVVAIDGDTSGMTFQDTGDSIADFALSRGGTQYVQLTRVLDTGVHDFTSPTKFVSRAVMRGAKGIVPLYPTTIPDCQRIAGQIFTCSGNDPFGFENAVSTIETVSTSDSGLKWESPSVLKNLPCRTDGWWANEAYCFGYHGAPQLAVDASGTAYLVWDNGHHIVLSHSTDNGATWSAPTPVDQGVPVAAYPAIVAGDNGRIAVAFYGNTALGRDIATPDNQWWVYLATSTDATASHPSFAQSVVSRWAVHEGTLCQTVGTGCGFLGSFGPAEAGSGIQVAMDPVTGHAIVAYSESRGVHDDGAMGGIEMTRQCTGPSLLVHPSARPCSTTPSVTSTGPAVCAPQGTDPAGDAQWSGKDQAALDLRRLGVRVGEGTLTAALDVTGFSAVPPVGATGSSWTVRWNDRGVRYFLRARSPSAGDPSAPSNDPSAPTLSYQWGTVAGTYGEVVAGSATGHVTGNTVVMSVPSTDVGDPQPGTKLTDFAAESDVLTGGVADAPAGTWSAVDRLSSRDGYDPGLHCPPIGTAASVAPLPTAPAARAATGGAAPVPSPLPSITPLPTVSVPPLLVPDPPVVPDCGSIPPPVPLPTPTPVPTPHRPHLRLFVPPPVIPFAKLDDGGIPDRAVAVAQPPPQAQAEAPQTVPQPLSQAVGAGAPQDEGEPAAMLATERGMSPNDEAAWMLAAATLTMATGAGLALGRRRRTQLGVERSGF